MNQKGFYPPLTEVRLSEGNAFYDRMARDLAYLKKLDCDRMLYNFRKAFGEDTRGAEPIHGWDEPDGLLRGHSTGHFIMRRTGVARDMAQNISPNPNIVAKISAVFTAFSTFSAFFAPTALAITILAPEPSATKALISRMITGLDAPMDATAVSSPAVKLPTTAVSAAVNRDCTSEEINRGSAN